MAPTSRISKRRRGALNASGNRGGEIPRSSTLARRASRNHGGTPAGGRRRDRPTMASPAPPFKRRAVPADQQLFGAVQQHPAYGGAPLALGGGGLHGGGAAMPSMYGESVRMMAPRAPADASVRAVLDGGHDLSGHQNGQVSPRFLVLEQPPPTAAAHHHRTGCRPVQRGCPGCCHPAPHARANCDLPFRPHHGGPPPAGPVGTNADHRSRRC